MNKLILTTLSVVLIAAGAATANAAGCPIWMCGTNGIQLNGIALQVPNLTATKASVVVLASGETINLDQ